MSTLGIDRFGVICWSGGGPVSYELAAAHPGRVAAVAAIAGVSTTFNPARTLRGRLEMGEERMLFTRLGTWFANALVDKAAASAISTLVAGEGDMTRSQAKTVDCSDHVGARAAAICDGTGQHGRCRPQLSVTSVCAFRGDSWPPTDVCLCSSAVAGGCSCADFAIASGGGGQFSDCISSALPANKRQIVNLLRPFNNVP
jgi:pimeloyl-ACP methyl ester carboxylesterase